MEDYAREDRGVCRVKPSKRKKVGSIMNTTC